MFKIQKLRLLYQNNVATAVGGTVNTTVVTLVLWQIFPGMPLILWMLFGIAVSGVRLMLQRKFQRQPTRLPPRTWLYLHRTVTFIAGSHFGFLSIFFFSSDYPLYQALVTFVIGGMSASAVAMHSVDLKSYYAYLLPATLPLVLQFILADGAVYWGMAFMTAIFILTMSYSSRTAHRLLIENINLNRALHHRATHDTLVALKNRNEFERTFQELAENAEQNSRPTSLIFIDLDNFKGINDKYGHQTGDKALIVVGEAIRTSLRKTDIAARMGGDEFVILIYPGGEDEAVVVAEKIQSKLTHEQVKSFGLKCEVGISVGICTSFRMQYDAMMKAADRACYEAKQAGKGKICTAFESTEVPEPAQTPTELPVKQRRK